MLTQYIRGGCVNERWFVIRLKYSKLFHLLIIYLFITKIISYKRFDLKNEVLHRKKRKKDWIPLQSI